VSASFVNAIPIIIHSESVNDVASNVNENVRERNRNDGKVITLDDDVHLIFSRKCPKDPVPYSLDYAICETDGSVWVRIGTVDEIHKKDTVEG
jgi:hypothetical protein